MTIKGNLIITKFKTTYNPWRVVYQHDGMDFKGQGNTLIEAMKVLANELLKEGIEAFND